MPRLNSFLKLLCLKCREIILYRVFFLLITFALMSILIDLSLKLHKIHINHAKLQCFSDKGKHYNLIHANEQISDSCSAIDFQNISRKLKLKSRPKVCSLGRRYSDLVENIRVAKVVANHFRTSATRYA